VIAVRTASNAQVQLLASQIRARRSRAQIRRSLASCNDSLGYGRIEVSQTSHEGLELMRRLRDGQAACVDYDEPQGIGLAAQIRRPTIHLGRGRLALAPRSVQPRGPYRRRTVE